MRPLLCELTVLATKPVPSELLSSDTSSTTGGACSLRIQYRRLGSTLCS